MLAIFDADPGTYDVFAFIAAVMLVVAAVLALPPNGSSVKAYATTVGWAALAVLSFGTLFLTP